MGLGLHLNIHGNEIVAAQVHETLERASGKIAARR